MRLSPKVVLAVAVAVAVLLVAVESHQTLLRLQAMGPNEAVAALKAEGYTLASGMTFYKQVTESAKKFTIKLTISTNKKCVHATLYDGHVVPDGSQGAGLMDSCYNKATATEQDYHASGKAYDTTHATHAGMKSAVESAIKAWG